MLQRLRNATNNFRKPDAQHSAAVSERHVGAHSLPYRDQHAELLVALTHESIHIALPGFHLSPGKLPSPRHLGRLRPLTSEDEPVNDDRRTDNDQGGGSFGLHGGQACQKKTRLPSFLEAKASEGTMGTCR